GLRAAVEGHENCRLFATALVDPDRHHRLIWGLARGDDVLPAGIPVDHGDGILARVVYVDERGLAAAVVVRRHPVLISSVAEDGGKRPVGGSLLPDLLDRSIELDALDPPVLTARALHAGRADAQRCHAWAVVAR